MGGSDAGTIWLVGMMGAGKTAVGRALAARLGRAFADSDAEVERAAGRSVAAIFETEGESGFRRREREAIEALADAGGGVVALGGGAIAQPGAAARLAETGTVVYLKASPEALAQRVGRGRRRPLLRDLDAAGRLAKLRELLEARREAYETARVIVCSEGDDVEAVVDRVVEKL